MSFRQHSNVIPDVGGNFCCLYFRFMNEFRLIHYFKLLLFPCFGSCLDRLWNSTDFSVQVFPRFLRPIRHHDPTVLNEDGWTEFDTILVQKLLLCSGIQTATFVIFFHLWISSDSLRTSSRGFRLWFANRRVRPKHTILGHPESKWGTSSHVTWDHSFG